MRVSAYDKVLKSKRERKRQQERKSLKEAAARAPKRRHKESSEESISTEDQSGGSAESLSNESEDVVSEQPEDVESEQPEDVKNIPQEVRVKKIRQRENKKADVKIEVCETCEVGEGDPIPCTKCKRVYHTACVQKKSGTEPNAQSFLCHNCDPSTDPHCTLCQKSEGEILSCSVKTCPLRYHPHCLKVFHFPTSKSEKPAAQFTCPAHYCHTCVADVNALHPPEKKLVRCIHCPTSYHPGNYFFLFLSLICNNFVVA